MSNPKPTNDGQSVSRPATLVTPALSPLESIRLSMLATPSDHPEHAQIMDAARRLKSRIASMPAPIEEVK